MIDQIVRVNLLLYPTIYSSRADVLTKLLCVEHNTDVNWWLNSSGKWYLGYNPFTKKPLECSYDEFIEYHKDRERDFYKNHPSLKGSAYFTQKNKKLQERYDCIDELVYSYEHTHYMNKHQEEPIDLPELTNSMLCLRVPRIEACTTTDLAIIHKYLEIVYGVTVSRTYDDDTTAFPTKVEILKL